MLCHWLRKRVACYLRLLPERVIVTFSCKIVEKEDKREKKRQSMFSVRLTHYKAAIFLFLSFPVPWKNKTGQLISSVEMVINSFGVFGSPVTKTDCLLCKRNSILLRNSHTKMAYVCPIFGKKLKLVYRLECDAKYLVFNDYCWEEICETC